MKYLFPEKFLTAKKDEKNFQELSLTFTENCLKIYRSHRKTNTLYMSINTSFILKLLQNSFCPLFEIHT